ncbi:siderophore-interacting protein [Novosphingobium sp. PhB165]|uniref:siderophore-interacting protein n=1 Tax=Novosphingobium sp. PhB165 TaxID=2485105 RepID=UPI001FB28D2F|nr:siderophore-interacting protein [Novosphingobium sp. PhB165]
MRRDIRRRRLTVSRVEPLGSAMLRVWLEGDDLADFESGSPDDHIKLFFAAEGAGPDEKPEMRDYTPRLYDTAARTLAIDFALHDPAGPATAWAKAAKPGDVLNIGGPRGSAVVTDDFDWYLLIGDETAIPQFSRRIEELRPGIPVTALVSVARGIERAPVPEREGLNWVWVEHDGHGEDAAPLLAALGDAGLPEGEGYAWIAAEAAVAQAIRAKLTDEMGHPLGWLRSSGYWTVGEAQG